MKRKQKNKKFIIVAIVLMLVISIGYAAISTTLRINGTANIAATSWNIYFDNITTTTGSVTPSVAPTVSGTNTTTLNYTIVLEKPGDFYEFTVDVVNGGTINAKIAENGIVKTGVDNTADTYVNYTATYSDGTAIAEGDTLGKSGTANNGDTRTIKIRVEYDDTITAEQLNALDSDLELTLQFSLNYVQD